MTNDVRLARTSDFELRTQGSGSKSQHFDGPVNHLAALSRLTVEYAPLQLQVS